MVLGSAGEWWGPLSQLACTPSLCFTKLRPCDCRSGQLDVQELISLPPRSAATSSSFTRSHPRPCAEFADLNQLTQGDQDKVAKCKRFLMSYLSRGPQHGGGQRL